jgi:uncharacterized RDD family membrane protein YckC
MKTDNFIKSEIIPDYAVERDVFGQVKSQRTSIIKRFKYKPANVPDLEVTYAGLGIRSLATFIDLIIISVLLIIPELFFFSFNFSDVDFNSYRILMGTGIWIFYHTTFDSSFFRGTPGKRLLKLRLIDLYGKNLSIVRAFFRSLAVFISIVPVGLGIWYITTDSKKRGWHDLISGSYVIRS